MTITLVAAIGSNGVIGKDGALPWPRTGDLAQFKSLTMGHVLLMGRRTYDSIGRALPGRTTVVLTRQSDWHAPGVLVEHDLASALLTASRVDPEVFVVGGEQVYAATLERANRLVLTHVDQAPDGDAWFPDVAWDQWREDSRERHDGYAIATYDRLR